MNYYSLLQGMEWKRQHITQAEFYSHRLMTRDPLAPRGPIVESLRSNQLRPQCLKRKRCDADAGPPIYNARNCSSHLPHAAGRLFQQYCVDVFSRIEAERIDFARRNQSMLRCHTLQELEHYLHLKQKVEHSTSLHAPWRSAP